GGARRATPGRGPLDPQPPRRGDEAGDGAFGRLPLQRRGADTLRLHLERVLRLGPGDVERSPEGRRVAPARAADARRRARRDPAADPPGDAVRVGVDLAGAE